MQAEAAKRRDRRESASASTSTSILYSTRLHDILYSLLLVATPFLLVRNYLQPVIETASKRMVVIGGFSIPVVLLLAAALVIGAGIALRRHLTWIRGAAFAAPLAMIALAQVFADYYYDHAFFELQQNWHYLAYMLVAVLMYRDLHPRGVPLARTMLLTYGFAFLYSVFDETFQMFLSARVFDVGDIAKDVWGALAGILGVYFAVRKPDEIRRDWKSIRHERIADYFRSPASVLTLLFAWGILFVMVSSLLTDPPYAFTVVAITASVWLLFFAALHGSRMRWGARILAGGAILALLALGTSFAVHRGDAIGSHRYGLTVYRGIPIPFFDVMFFPDGSFRLVDKKHFFRDRDRALLWKKQSDILLIGSGYRGEGNGGLGFPERTKSQFVWNRFSCRGTQVIILPSGEACRLYNRLRAERKSVLFVLHATC
ncbi:MAG: VanZ family protein [Candidatus Eisenbacteria bacterium]|nr:VanZ family protein [Candidatus Eisenbacteria bacterium]